MTVKKPAGERRAGIALLIAGVVFVVFVANVIIGKVSLLLGASAPADVGNRGEFALLCVAVACFVVAILEKERLQSGQSEASTQTEEE